MCECVCVWVRGLCGQSQVRVSVWAKTHTAKVKKGEEWRAERGERKNQRQEKEIKSPLSICPRVRVWPAEGARGQGSLIPGPWSVSSQIHSRGRIIKPSFYYVEKLDVYFKNWFRSKKKNAKVFIDDVLHQNWEKSVFKKIKLLHSLHKRDLFFMQLKKKPQT